ncbi:MAG TPA: NAD(P)-binding domain-containing protein [Paenibacillus sp.]|jgi:lysine/ornithine N-monooxygenase
MKKLEMLGVVVGAGPKGISTLIQLQRAFPNKFIGVESCAVVSNWDSQFAGSSPTRTGIYYSDTIVQQADIPWNLQTFVKRHPLMSEEMLNKDYLPKEVLQDYYRMSAEAINARILLGEKVEEIEVDKKGFLLKTSSYSIKTRYLIISTGPVNHKVFPEWTYSLPPHLCQHSIGHGMFDNLLGKKILLVGGGHATPDIACRMWELGGSITVVVRKSGLKTSYLPYPDDYINPNYWELNRGLSIEDRISVLRKISLEGPWVTPRSLREFEDVIHASKKTSNRIEYLTSTKVTSCRIVHNNDCEQVEITFYDGRSELFDKVICATGFKPDVTKLPFINHEIWINTISEGLPHLNNDYSFKGNSNIYFTGHFAQLGPRGIVDSILHYTQYATMALTNSILEKEGSFHVSNY